MTLCLWSLTDRVHVDVLTWGGGQLFMYVLCTTVFMCMIKLLDQCLLPQTVVWYEYTRYLGQLVLLPLLSATSIVQSMSEKS